MEMTLRWFGPGYDSVRLEHIRQIPGVKSVITMLYGMPPGKAWETEDIRALKAAVEGAGLKIAGIESVNVHESIKAGWPEREEYIESYIVTLRRLGREGIRLVCYNFMPVFDWTRSDLAKMRPDGSTVFAYDHSVISRIDPAAMFGALDEKSNGFVLPGWEPERMGRIRELFELYRDVDEEKLFQNLVHFLTRIRPVCEEYGIKMAIHPDDPSWSVFGLPRIVTGRDTILRLMRAVDAEFNGVTLCSGSLGSDPANDIPSIIHALKGRIHFAHVRNVRHTGRRSFEETAHLSSEGSLDMYAITKALYDSGFDGVIRPDHGRAVWGEVSMPGYGLYDRAMGACYLNGLWEAIAKADSGGRICD